LLCVLCGGRWETSETVCAGCGERDLSKFRVMANRDAGPATIESCGGCGTAVKVFSASDLVWGPPVALEVATVRLDLLAERDEDTFRDPVALAALFPPA
jgi:formate dehydrogenase maturation protein FdhE